jgi:hypothetical protein
MIELRECRDGNRGWKFRRRMRVLSFGDLSDAVDKLLEFISSFEGWEM